jgi:hypothetical protein
MEKRIDSQISEPMSWRVRLSQEHIGEFCRRWQIVELALFGSALREDFRTDSDVDLLALFDPQANHTLFDMVRMQDELKGILGCNVDLVSRRAIESARNPIRQKSILDSAVLVYGTRSCLHAGHP